MLRPRSRCDTSLRRRKGVHSTRCEKPSWSQYSVKSRRLGVFVVSRSGDSIKSTRSFRLSRSRTIYSNSSERGRRYEHGRRSSAIPPPRADSPRVDTARFHPSVGGELRGELPNSPRTQTRHDGDRSNFLRKQKARRAPSVPYLKLGVLPASTLLRSRFGPRSQNPTSHPALAVRQFPPPQLRGEEDFSHSGAPPHGAGRGASG